MSILKIFSLFLFLLFLRPVFYHAVIKLLRLGVVLPRYTARVYNRRALVIISLNERMFCTLLFKARLKINNCAFKCCQTLKCTFNAGGSVH